MSSTIYINNFGTDKRPRSSTPCSNSYYIQQSPSGCDSYQPQEASLKDGIDAAGTVLFSAVALGGAAILARKHIPELKSINPKKVLANDAKFIDKLGNKFAKYTDWLEEHTIGWMKKHTQW